MAANAYMNLNSTNGSQLLTVFVVSRQADKAKSTQPYNMGSQPLNGRIVSTLYACTMHIVCFLDALVISPQLFHCGQAAIPSHSRLEGADRVWGRNALHRLEIDYCNGKK